MKDGAIIGDVVAKGGGRFDWIIPDFSRLPRRMDAFFESRYSDDRWFLRIHPNGYYRKTQIHIMLWRLPPSDAKYLSWTVCVKRADHSEETMDAKTSGYTTSYNFKRTRRELEEEGGWLADGQLTITLRFTPQAKRKLSSCETLTDSLYTKIRKVEDCRCTGAKGVIQLSENLKGLLTEENKDYNVKIFVKSQEFRAHSLILRARSPVLGMMLTHDSAEKNSGTIHIEDCDPDCFDAFLLFLYSGRTEELDTSKALSLYYAADKYDLPLLKEECVTFLEASLSTTSVCNIVLLAARHDEEQLLRTATDFFVKNIKQILLTVEWQNFMAQNPTVANELLVKTLGN